VQVKLEIAAHEAMQSSLELQTVGWHQQVIDTSLEGVQEKPYACQD